MFLRAAGALFLGVLLRAETVLAGDVPPEFEPFVVGASRRRQSLEDVPESVTVISQEEIKRFGWRTITDVLANVRGLYVTNDRNYSFLGVRGFARPGDYNTRVLVLVNGHATNDAVYESSMVGRGFPVDMELVERIEVIRGPGSALYGSSALLAVINVVTRTGPDVRHLDGAGVRAAVEKDGVANTKTTLAFDKLIAERAHLLISGGYDSGLGESYRFDVEDADFPVRTDRSSDATQAWSTFASLTYGPLSLTGSLHSYGKNVPTASFGVIPDAGEHTRDLRGFAEAKLELAPRDDLDLTTRAFLDYTRYDGIYPYRPADGGTYRDASRSVGAGADAIATWRPIESLVVTGGATAQRYFGAEQVNELPGLDFYFRDRRSFNTAAVYADVELNLGSMITVTAGGRYDWYGTFGSRASPRLALVFRPVPGSTLKLLYGEAFRAPSLYELYYESGEGLANPDLEPEVLRHSVAIAEQELGGGRGLLTLSFYHYTLDNLIDAFDLDGAITFVNSSSAEALGAELELSGRLPWLGARGTAGYTFSNVLDGETHRRLSNAPQHVFQVRGLVPLYENRIFLASAVRYVGDRPGLAAREAAPGAFTADLTLSVDDLAEGVDFSAGVTNVFDREWMVPGSVEHAQALIPQDGRTVWAKISCLF